MKFEEYEFLQAIKKADLMLRPNALVINPVLLKEMGEDAKAELEKYCTVYETPQVDIKHAFVIDRAQFEDSGVDFIKGVDDMYQSPIDVIQGEFHTYMENEVFKAVKNVGIEVDKDELIKALQYDRGQYDKGYKDGYEKGQEDARKEICEMIQVENHD